MISVTVGNNISRKSEPYPPNTTIRTILEEAELDYSTGGIHLDGATLGAGDFDKTLADFNITDRCYLLSVVKADNA